MDAVIFRVDYLSLFCAESDKGRGYQNKVTKNSLHIDDQNRWQRELPTKTKKTNKTFFFKQQKQIQQKTLFFSLFSNKQTWKRKHKMELTRNETKKMLSIFQRSSASFFWFVLFCSRQFCSFNTVRLIDGIAMILRLVNLACDYKSASVLSAVRNSSAAIMMAFQEMSDTNDDNDSTVMRWWNSVNK